MTPRPAPPAQVGGVAALAAVSGAAFHRAFELHDLLPVVVLAAVGAALFTAVLHRLAARVSVTASLAASAIVWALVTTPALFGSTDVPGTLVAATRAWGRLLDSTLWAQPEPGLLLVPQILTWAAAATATEIVVRTDAALLPVLPSALVLPVAAAYTVSGPGTNLLTGALFVTLAVVLVMVRSRRTDAEAVPPAAGIRAAGTSFRRGKGVRQAVAVVTAGAAVSTALALAHPGLTPGQPVDPRAAVPTVEVTDLNPLSRAASWSAAPGHRLFTVRSARAQNWTLAVLDEFDGRQWSTRARLTGAGVRLPQPQEAPSVAPLHQDVVIDELEGIFLPAATTPSGVRGADWIAVDADTGTLVSTVPLHRGLAYSVESAVPVTGAAGQLVSLRPGTGPEATAALRVPAGVPAEVTALARQATGTARTPFQQAAALETYLRVHYRHDPAAAPGTSYGHLRRFLGPGRSGTSGQFAAAFAVAARTLGLPSRVVVGFTTGHPEPGGTDRQVRSEDALVWDEVYFEDAGWTPFYPTPPATRPTGSGAEREAAPGESADRVAQMAAVRALVPPPLPPASWMPQASTTRTAGTPWWSYLLAALTALLAATAGRLLAPSLRRHRRRTRGSPRRRVVSAWADALEHLAAAGTPVPASATTSHVVSTAAGRIGHQVDHALAPLAELVATALYAPEPIPPDSAERAWHWADELRRSVRAGRSPHRGRGRLRTRIEEPAGRPT